MECLTSPHAQFSQKANPNLLKQLGNGLCPVMNRISLLDHYLKISATFDLVYTTINSIFPVLSIQRVKPQSVQITTVPTVLKAGQRVEVNCQSEGSRPPARISWTKGSERVDHLAIQNTFGSISVSTLSFVASGEDNGKKLTCEAQNPKLPESALRDSWTLNVLYPPQLSLVFGASVQYEHIREGSDVYFECNIQANPPVSEVKWLFNSKNLVHDSLRGIIVRNHSLLLHNVGRRNRGTYQCLASNAQGRGRSEEVVLRVQYSPVCSERQRRNYGVAKNEEVNVLCSVDSDPQEVAFKWVFNSSLSETTDLFSFINNGTGKSIAKFTPKTKTDYGALYCFAKNEVGNMRDPCIFNIVPTGPPEPLQNCTITNQSFSSLSLSCDIGDDGGSKQSFHLEIYSMRREQLLANVTSHENPSFIVRGLPAGTSFIVVVYSSNSKGRSTSVALTASTLFSAERQTEDENKSVISAVLLVSLAALGTLALLAVAAVVAVVKNKTRSSSNEVATTGQEMVEKNPKPSKPAFEDGNPYVYHTREVTTDYVHLTPKSASECIYERLMDGKPSSYETVLCRSHVLNEEFNRWVPHELTAEDKSKRKAACLALLRDQRKEKIVDRIVTYDKKKNGCTATIQAVKEGGQHLGNQQDWLQDEP
ncbi:Nephrin [Araneus ventricosus]|uniref:Nephrin n=1 Tax=Araneus ventricosus TaxID=182803 RepID=A0A4Y2JTZ8_ARAVE|nr:Nephrin [Araneus ventricosus]